MQCNVAGQLLHKIARGNEAYFVGATHKYEALSAADLKLASLIVGDMTFRRQLAWMEVSC